MPGRQIRLVRNPRFREWSRAAQPAGYPDEIVIRPGGSDPAQVRSVARGEADIADFTVSRVDVAALRARYGGRLHSVPGPFVFYTLLNTRLPPFDDVRVRRALNYAVDRSAVVRANGGPDRASASCQVLPANYPGYRPYCTYERNLAKARRLVTASGTRGMRVVVWTRTSNEPSLSYVVNALRTLGYRARLKVIDDKAYFDAIADNDKLQASSAGWVADLPSAAVYTLSLLDYLKSVAGFSDGAIERQIGRALELQQTDPSAANELWASVDRMITDRAPVVPMYNAREVQLVSPRVGNYQFHPLWLALLDQLWVR